MSRLKPHAVRFKPHAMKVAIGLGVITLVIASVIAFAGPSAKSDAATSASLATSTTAAKRTTTTPAPTTTAPPTTKAAPPTTKAPAPTAPPTAPPTTQAPAPTAPPTTQAPAPAPVVAATHGACGGNLPPCCIMYRESGGNPTAVNPSSGASGKWQFMPDTWQNYQGYPTAASAPEAVQDARAAEVWAGGAGAGHWGGGC